MIKRRFLLDVLVLTALLARADGILKKPQYKILSVTGPFRITPEITKLLQQEAGDEYQKLLMRAQMIVNALVPNGFMMLSPEFRYYYTGQVVLRLVSTGWMPPNVPVIVAFVQSLYDMHSSFQLQNPPTNVSILENITRSADTLRDKGLFGGN